MKIFSYPKALNELKFHYCPGCTHGIAHRLLAEVLEEMGLLDKTIGVGSVGCSAYIYEHYNFDFIQAAHGRASSVATGVKRVYPDRVVFAYQGDGDMAGLGLGEAMHTAVRGEKITVVFINNAVYGMTGGQMAPTSLISQKTSTTPRGRDPESAGYPIRLLDMMAVSEGCAFAARAALNSPKNVLKAKEYLRMAFQCQLDRKGYSIVEFLSTCPTNWRLDTARSLKYIDEVMSSFYPPGIIKQA
ncbi:MAG TPA: thiamine pyrophosphate-dependent enzyme [bacterium]|nr:2-oxoglutarate oxidoreductase [Dictyoglomota bacterium]HHV80149.1 2-oxoglutarate oxidoreductase [bacterium]HOK29654.1 thiamine pyrophosphate-dependent enzyme [bacterium]HOL54949.1 thiamine pyrophosphate-dependent enzyme [bacterium]HON72375.1 thiamine pyrophosphate-dependent enzyme [bacterium]